jgi:hypothetical protein
VLLCVGALDVAPMGSAVALSRPSCRRDGDGNAAGWRRSYAIPGVPEARNDAQRSTSGRDGGGGGGVCRRPRGRGCRRVDDSRSQTAAERGCEARERRAGVSGKGWFGRITRIGSAAAPLNFSALPFACQPPSRLLSVLFDKANTGSSHFVQLHHLHLTVAVAYLWNSLTIIHVI